MKSTSSVLPSMAPAAERPERMALDEHGARFMSNLGRFRSAGLAAALVLLGVLMSLVEPHFLSADNVRAILLDASIVAALAAAQSVVVISGNIDLSVGSIVGVTAFVTAVMLDHGDALVIAVVAALALGLGLGLVNGVLVGAGRAASIVITLGTLSIFRGLLLAIAHGKEISAYQLPNSYLSIASRLVFGVPLLFIIAIFIVVLIGIFMRFTVSGRRIYARGSSGQAAEIIGIRGMRLTIGVFALSGVVAAAGGVLWGARYATINSSAATGLEFTVITAVVLGGVNIFGGSGAVWGSTVGALLLATVGNSLTLLAVSQFWLGAIQGILILAAIATDAGVRSYVGRLGTTGRR